ncbi:YihA family ribosome biogenesis GTP-binding protein [Tenacibaculum finnmarkense genomovar finnmarkense]|uniref:ribosome biogenesis GTP-binding protein YihA/YsxC n=1 Tax=Tenacibaculum finnmarkense TaxID=2781243 RepID=UPI000C66F150|nr:ribosome biogenesis GTP-binding protein YihA/YsxC [Tenacibaculum finnmarkense]MBE7660073.1 YihA family ribosome biogenesis GTP-binding protein [Tenacibaculum finnmarkense genomovar finnmarkense]MBE7692864.1 YihA family ribosome biogenesis GTP-binding protein [Tenacibaculum finnmarkense genomovar finnmarkense]MCD8403161.1 ribosome biogenesis GTP-binding protein YihA/YsxC [Tenacibaculum finnmarkense genomovar finnmarkense]MCD8416608.1 ribosome biogenesis GTP-binding protein YihA/YsxC [Tenaciba
MKIRSADFVMSNSNVMKAPKDRIPEYAFIGRSNVGKSSLINMLMQRKDLAKTSGKPGKTQLINHFKINEEWFLVDLPGYGYAQISKKKRTIFQFFIENYFKEREQLVFTFILIDSRHDPQKIDLEFMQFLGENQIPFGIVFTKADKLGSSKINNQIANYKKKLLKHWETLPTSFVTSSETGLGREEFLSFIETTNETILKDFE